MAPSGPKTAPPGPGFANPGQTRGPAPPRVLVSEIFSSPGGAKPPASFGAALAPGQPQDRAPDRSDCRVPRPKSFICPGRGIRQCPGPNNRLGLWAPSLPKPLANSCGSLSERARARPAGLVTAKATRLVGRKEHSDQTESQGVATFIPGPKGPLWAPKGPF